MGTRDEESALNLTMSAKWAGKRIYAYAFVIGGASYNRGLASMTEYLGAFGAEAPAKTDNEGGEQNNGGSNTGSNTGGSNSGQSGTQTGGNTGGNDNSGSTNEETLAAPVISGTSPFDESTEVTITGSTNVRAIAIKDGQSSQAVSRMFSKSTGGNDEPVDTE